MSVVHSLDWHEGEEIMHRKLRQPHLDNPTISTLSHQAMVMLERAPLIAIGCLDTDSRPWTTLVGGEMGFSQTLARGVIGMRTPVAARHDPVIEALLGKEARGEVVKEEGEGRMIGGLAINLETRKRVKLYGRMIAGALGSSGSQASFDGEAKHTEMQLAVRIDQSLGKSCRHRLCIVHPLTSIRQLSEVS